MSKVIKFRIWNPEEKMMIESGATPMMLANFFEGTARMNTQHEMPYLQFTGLLDKTGREIYEGDIVGAFLNTQKTVVEWCDDRAGYFFEDCILSGGSEPFTECLGNLTGTLEVIGNVYENPELLIEKDPTGITEPE